MKRQRLQNGFSLAEILIAIGIMTIGLLFVAGVFPVAIHYSTVMTERTIAAVVADEAFAKIHLYGVSLTDADWTNFNVLYETVWTGSDTGTISFDEFAYPSTTDVGYEYKNYFWTAICRRLNYNNVQVTVFVCRKTNRTQMYPNPVPNAGDIDRPRAYRVTVNVGAIADELVLVDDATTGYNEISFINDGYTIVDNETGAIYRVLERYASDNEVIKLDRDIEWDTTKVSGSFWVVPPAVGGSRNTCIGVFQRVIRF